MRVLRIVANLHAAEPEAVAEFYARVFGLEVEAGRGWIVFLAAPAEGRQRMQIASEGGSGTELPAVSIEVDDLDAALTRAREAGAEIAYGPATEPWGVSRFYLRDPAGNLINVVTHA